MDMGIVIHRHHILLVSKCIQVHRIIPAFALAVTEEATEEATVHRLVSVASVATLVDSVLVWVVQSMAIHTSLAFTPNGK